MKPSMRILHVIAGAGRGGAETFCLDAIEALHEAGVTQRVVCRPHGHFLAALDKRGVSYDLMAFNYRDRLGRGRALIEKSAAAFAPDLVHAWMGRAASFIPKSLTVPVLGWFGGYYDLKRYRTCDFYMGVTKDIVRHIGEKTGEPRRAFLVHTLGTLEAAPPADRAALATPVNAPVVLLLSRMHWKKGVDTLLEAAGRLPGVYFWLAGDGPELEKYRALSAGLGLADRFRFLGWRTDRAALLGAADVCVLPSRYEPFGTVIPEAWSMEVPLVATRAAGARQYVTDGENGLLCAIDNPAELAEKINLAVNDGAVRDRLKKNGFIAYQENFSKKVVVDSLIRAYGDIKKAGKKTKTV
jgi:glycosyltransferase involved in cell wall biosynthesis